MCVCVCVHESKYSIVNLEVTFIVGVCDLVPLCVCVCVGACMCVCDFYLGNKLRVFVQMKKCVLLFINIPQGGSESMATRVIIFSLCVSACM